MVKQPMVSELLKLTGNCQPTLAWLQQKEAQGQVLMDGPELAKQEIQESGIIYLCAVLQHVKKIHNAKHYLTVY